MRRIAAMLAKPFGVSGTDDKVGRSVHDSELRGKYGTINNEIIIQRPESIVRVTMIPSMVLRLKNIAVDPDVDVTV